LPIILQSAIRRFVGMRNWRDSLDCLTCNKKILYWASSSNFISFPKTRDDELVAGILGIWKYNAV
jgi:hypothetical protein